MHGSKNYLWWRDPGPSATVFFSPYLNIQKSNGFFSKKTITFKAPEGSNNFQGGGGSIQLLIPYQDPNNLYSVRNYTGNNLQAPVATGSCFDGRNIMA